MQDSLPMEPVPYALPKYLSPSSIGTFNQCPMRYKYAKLDKIPEPSTEPRTMIYLKKIPLKMSLGGKHGGVLKTIS